MQWTIILRRFHRVRHETDILRGVRTRADVLFFLQKNESVRLYFIPPFLPPLQHSRARRSMPILRKMTDKFGKTPEYYYETLGCITDSYGRAATPYWLLKSWSVDGSFCTAVGQAILDFYEDVMPKLSHLCRDYVLPTGESRYGKIIADGNSHPELSELKRIVLSHPFSSQYIDDKFLIGVLDDLNEGFDLSTYAPEVSRFSAATMEHIAERARQFMLQSSLLQQIKNGTYNIILTGADLVTARPGNWSEWFDLNDVHSDDSD